MPGEDEARNLSLVYQENAKVVAMFLDWRYKVMTRWFAVTGAVFVAGGWLYQQPGGRPWLAVPFVLGAIFSTISALLDRRNVRILQECYRIGGEIESKLVGQGAIYNFIGETHDSGITYTRVLQISYFGLALLLLLLSVLSVLLIR